MGWLVSDLILRFKRVYPSCESTFALDLLNDTTKSLGMTSENREQMITVQMVQGQREYIIDPKIIMVGQAYYVSVPPPDNAVAGGIALYGTSKDALSQYQFGYLTYNALGGPWWYYVGTASADTSTVPATFSDTLPGAANVIGFNPAPTVTSSGGYPCVRFFATTWTPFGMNDYLPDNWGTQQQLIDKMALYYAGTHVLQDVPLRVRLSDATLNETKSRMNSTVLQAPGNRIGIGWLNRRGGR